MKPIGGGSIYKYEDNNGKQKYYVKYREFDSVKSKYVSRTKRGFNRKTDAKNFLEEINAEQRIQSFSPLRDVRMKEMTQMWRAMYLLTGVRENTIAWHDCNIKYIEKFLGEQTVGDLGFEQVLSFIETCSEVEKNGKHLSVTTIEHILRTLRQVLDYAVEKQIVRENAARNGAVNRVLKQMKKNAESYEPVVLSNDEIIATVESCRGSTISVVIALAGFAGLRLSEILGLTLESFQNGKIYVEFQRTRKNELAPLKSKSSRRVVPCHPYVQEIINEYQDKKKRCASLYPDDYKETPFLVVNIDNLKYLGRPISRSTIGKMLAAVKEANHLDENLTLHHFRHSYGSNLIAGGIPIPVVSNWLGHGDSAITMSVYVHEIESQKDENVDRFVSIMNDSLAEVLK